jgi:diaminohydroxyphosphoribosylaminopyrimidine deaminase/5-amino-6-(5-phosphoribosylamino)uracil reductase
MYKDSESPDELYMNNIFYLRKTLELAANGKGRTSPNPLVGAVIVKNNIIIGEGWHKKFGGLHAEVEAINNALKKHNSKKLKGATLYVNLEPCSHFGANPPCADIIISYGIKEVVFCTNDPNSLVNGKGEKYLKKFNIKVRKNILVNEARKLNEIYFKYILQKKPFIILKTALSLDGRITHPTQKYLNNKQALQYVHELRNQVDAILIGYNTNRKDRPQLTCRIKGGRNPKKIILPKKKVNLKKLLEKLGQEKISSILVEGGSQVITSFLQENLGDKVILLYTPEIYGSQQLAYCQKINKIVKLKDIEIRKLGDNIILEGYVK